MTTVTDDGLEALSDVSHGFRAAEIDAVGVGTGTGNEATGATSLANEAYRADKSNEDIEFVEAGASGAVEAIITVTGGQEVSAGAEINEIGVYIGEQNGNATLVVIDEFANVTVEDGHTEEFTVPYDFTR